MSQDFTVRVSSPKVLDRQHVVDHLREQVRPDAGMEMAFEVVEPQPQDRDAQVALNLQAITTDTTTVGNIIDLANYNWAMFTLFSKTVTDGTYTPLLEEGNDPGLSDAAAVADADLVGTEAAAAFAAADDNAVKKLGYVGSKRYVRLSIVSASTTTGVDAFGAIVHLDKKTK